MSLLVRYLRSSIGLKFLMAVSGLIMVGFLITHMAGNMLFFGGAEAIDSYAESLRNLGPLLWVLRLGLLGAVALHIFAGVRLAALARSARPEGYGRRQNFETTLAARTMLLSGLLVLFFILYHLAHFTFRMTNTSLFESMGPFEVHRMLVESFQSPYVSLFYVAAIVCLMFHLNHGIGSLCQTLGLNHSKYNKYIGRLSLTLSFVLGVGFISLPLSVLLGLVR